MSVLKNYPRVRISTTFFFFSEKKSDSPKSSKIRFSDFHENPENPGSEDRDFALDADFSWFHENPVFENFGGSEKKSDKKSF